MAKKSTPVKCARSCSSHQHGSQVSIQTKAEDLPRSTRKWVRLRAVKNIFCVNGTVKDVCHVNEVEEKRERVKNQLRKYIIQLAMSVARNINIGGRWLRADRKKKQN